MADVVCLGILVADIWGRPVDEWPQRGTLGVIEEVGIGVGGCAANSGTDLARLGVDVAVMGCLGEDPFADFVLERLSGDTVDVSGITRTTAAGTSSTLVLIDSGGERTFLHYFGANAHVKTNELDMDKISGAKLLHLAGALLMPGFDGEPQAQVLAAAQAAGVRTCVDVVWDDTSRWMELVAPLLPYTDFFLPSLSEAQQLTGLKQPEDVAGALLDTGVEVVALTMGEKGCYVCAADAELRLPAYPVEVVDGTGAGDAFAAGFIYGYLQEWDLERTAKFASAMGSLATTAAGTTAGIHDYGQIIDFLQQQEAENW